MKTLIAVTGIAIALIAVTGCEKAQEGANAATQTTKAIMEKAGAKVDKNAQAAKKKASAASAGLAADASRDREDRPQAAVAVLQATAGNEIKGTVRFTPQGDGVMVETVATGLSPGEHGYHIHIYGDCSIADGSSAGTHFNLQGSSLNPPKNIDHITGNLGTLFADQNGNAQANTVLEHAALSGPKSIIGRAVIVHANANDPKQPPIGAAGARQACGVIGIAQPPQRG